MKRGSSSSSVCAVYIAPRPTHQRTSDKRQSARRYCHEARSRASSMWFASNMSEFMRQGDGAALPRCRRPQSREGLRQQLWLWSSLVFFLPLSADRLWETERMSSRSPLSNPLLTLSKPTANTKPTKAMEGHARTIYHVLREFDQDQRRKSAIALEFRPSIYTSCFLAVGCEWCTYRNSWMNLISASEWGSIHRSIHEHRDRLPLGIMELLALDLDILLSRSFMPGLSEELKYEIMKIFFKQKLLVKSVTYGRSHVGFWSTFSQIQDSMNKFSVRLIVNCT